VLRAQEQVNDVKSRKGEVFLYWGWNRGVFSTSDIQFTGKNYDFTIENAVAHDRQTPFNTYDYFHPCELLFLNLMHVLAISLQISALFL
jgi:hypothetical protein